MDFGGGDEIRFERKGRAGVVTLTRPKALNALSHGMVRALAKALAAWEDDPTIAAVLIRGEGRAFCSGGDIMQVYAAHRAGEEPPAAFFADEYRLNAHIERYRKPYVALIDGIVMGGGVGVSFHGSHRVVTENAQFAMPEVGIGFFPDVGASHLLPKLGGHFGRYLALTGNRIGWGDVLGCGLATHAINAADQERFAERLCDSGDADAALEGLTVSPARETEAAVLEAIGRHFARPSLPEIIEGLKAEVAADPFAARTLSTIEGRSPTSLLVAWREIEAGRGLSMADCMRMEFRILVRMLAGHDFYEGIRAAIVDKDRQPKWQPSRIEDVSTADIDAYFAPLGKRELTF
ncbi:enoyl-CoA hydratase/isomerase family protein [Ollibium composti]|uniref:3-hydroxyisobutyryl-CoA hydrolase n=1 Tax=Ollibium composti TaxID=2675109 RepID=A0ABY2QCG9_9HYPH|nr:enoyl-CoA hydratase/isomerase family protein [Mesorhizobium composti]THF59805.1 enoyl-CoA hydratase/isomerase family protein [Mesorhizobium composti]